MRNIPSLLLALTLLIGCSRAPAAATRTVPLPSPVVPTATPTLDRPEAVVAAYMTAWEQRDPEGIYQLLSPTRRTEVGADGFAARYQAAIQTATPLTLSVTLYSLLQEGDRAQAACRFSLETALVGTLVTDTVLSLVQEGGRWWLDGSGDLIWPGLGEANYFYMDYETPPRRNIYDRSGLALAAEGVIVTVGVVPGEIEDEGRVLTVLSQITGLSEAEIQARYAGQPATWWTPIADIPAEVSVEHPDLLETPGIEAREKRGRTYPGGGVAPHVVGWTSLIPAEEADVYRAAGYRGDEWVGVAGLEGWGEQYLAGQHGGTLYLLGPDGTSIAALAHRDPVPSRPIYTTLDLSFQQQVQDILGDHRGAIVVLDVHTGAVLALVSGPSFDPNVFVGPARGPERNAVLADPDHPLFNRATQGLYPPGSVFKVVGMAAALESAGLTPDTTFYCPGYWDGLGSQYRKFCWKEDGHGEITLKDGLTASCNVTFYNVAQTLYGIDPDLLSTYGRGFGLGAPVGILGVEEESQPIPDSAWNPGQGWYLGDVVNMVIGQGDLRATPIQVARMMAAIANGGTLYRPYVVRQIGPSPTGGDEIRFEPEVVGMLPISSENLAVIQEAMAAVTTSPIGTAHHRFVGMSIPVAGKTGTAEVGGEDTEPHSWFAGYAPADDPQIAFAVIVENAGEGSTVAAPMARQVVEAYFGLPLTPLPPEAFATPTPTPAP